MFSLFLSLSENAYKGNGIVSVLSVTFKVMDAFSFGESNHCGQEAEQTQLKVTVRKSQKSVIICVTPRLGQVEGGQ